MLHACLCQDGSKGEQDMKASWSGFLTLGPIAIPMRLYTAVRSAAPQYVQVHAKDHSPIERVYKCQQEGGEVPYDEIVRAVPVERGFIEVTRQDIQRQRGDIKSIDIKQFSDPGHIDPSYYEKPYYMVPGKGGELAYALLRQTLERTQKTAIITFVLYEKERLGIVTVFNGLLRLQQLRFADEIVPLSTIKLPSLPQPGPEQINLALSLLERYSMPLHVEDYHSEQNDIVHEIIDRKTKGLELKRPSQPLPHASNEAEITPALKALLEDKDRV